MPWDDIARKQHNRDRLWYPRDLTDEEWALLVPFIPPAKHGGRPRTTDMREVMNAILYIAGAAASGGCCPRTFRRSPPCGAIFYSWRDTGLWQTVNQILVAVTRELEGRKRHIITDTLGLVLFALIHGADVQDRDGAPGLLKAIRIATLGCATFSPTGPAPETNSAALSRATVIGHSRSSNAPTPPGASRSCPVDGWWNAHSPGSTDAEAQPAD